MKKILIVDDDEMVLSGLAATLESEGYGVDTAHSGNEAIQAMEARLPDLVLTDLVMEDVDGMALLRRVIERWPTVPVVVLTGHGTADSAMEAVRNGAADFIQKPAKPEDIVSRIAGVLAGVEMRRKLETERESARERQMRTDSRAARRIRLNSLNRMGAGLAGDLDRMLERLDAQRAGGSRDAAQKASDDFIAEIRELRRKLHPAAAAPGTTAPLVRLSEQIQRFADSAALKRVRESAPGVRFELRLTDGLPPLRMNPDHLETILKFLTPGAFVSSSPAGRVIFITGVVDLEKPFGHCNEGSPGRYQFFRIQHTGYISPEDLEHVFEPYYALQQMKREATGAFGFTQVLDLVHMASGVLELRSEQRLGTELTIYLPISADVESVGPTVDAAEARGTALVVDDQEGPRITETQLLKSMGYEVESAAHIAEAVELCASRHESGSPRFDLALIDLLLGETSDGVDLGLRLREIEPDLPVILMSGFADSERLSDARKLGLGRQVQKPVTREALSKAIQSALAEE